MSDIPELDRLIEESENVRRNKKWRRQDRFFKISMLLMFLSFILLFLTTPIFGPNIAAIILIVFFLPIVLLSFCDMIGDFLKDDWEGRDMTKRYQRK